eukprot:scaffold116123_cov32-Tisochrysis_lutea.AAC.3
MQPQPGRTGVDDCQAPWLLWVHLRNFGSGMLSPLHLHPLHLEGCAVRLYEYWVVIDGGGEEEVHMLASLARSILNTICEPSIE